MSNQQFKLLLVSSLILIAASLFLFVLIFEGDSPEDADQSALVDQTVVTDVGAQQGGDTSRGSNERSNADGNTDGAANADAITFADAALEQVIRKALDKQIGDLTKSDLLSITELDAEQKLIMDLDGIEHLENLKSLNLRNNFIVDVTPLKGLRHLEELDIRGNRLTDITPLRHLTSLFELNIRDNDISDISALAELSQLQRLVARDNAIVDISPLAAAQNLFDLNLRGNNIVDVSPLLELPNLQDRLYLDGNPIENLIVLAPIAGLIKDIDFDISSELAKLHFSRESGFYTEPFALHLTSNSPNAKIYYTLDGSEPSENATLYDKPIQISNNKGKANRLSKIRTTVDHLPAFWREPDGEVFKGTVVRAMAIDEDGVVSPVVTHTYFVDERMHSKYSFPLISIVTPEDNLFDRDVGLYVNGNWEQRGRETEIPIHISFFEPDGKLGFSQNAGLRMQGGWTRRVAHKSLRIYARSEYDEQNAFFYEVFPGLKRGRSEETLARFDRLILRNSGNDFDSTLFRDAMIQRLVGHMNMDTQAYRPAIVFINGEYWGIHNIRERYDDWYVHNHYGVKRDEVTIIENGALSDGDPAGFDDYDALINYVMEHSLERAEHYEYVTDRVDIDNLIDYYVAQIFIGNTDWPHNNTRIWKYNGKKSDQFGHDGKWRWMLYDTDFGFGRYHDNVPWHDTLSHTVGDSYDKVLFTYLLNNKDFKVQFINRFADMMNTTFDEERMIAVIDEMAAVVQKEIGEHIARWGTIGSIHYWRGQVESIKEYALERKIYQVKYIEDYFALSGTYKLTVRQNLSQGQVRVNTIDISPDTPGIANASHWQGVYFNDVPLELTAVPKEGYRFKHWEGLDGLVTDATRPTVTITPHKNVNVVAVFEKS